MDHLCLCSFREKKYQKSADSRQGFLFCTWENVVGSFFGTRIWERSCTCCKATATGTSQSLLMVSVEQACVG